MASREKKAEKQSASTRTNVTRKQAKELRASASAASSAATRRPKSKKAVTKAERPVTWDVAAIVTWLKAHSSKETLDGMSRYAIPSTNALGVAMRDLKVLGKLVGRNHSLALALWQTKIYEARLVAAFVAEPTQLTASEMEAWCRDFDNWAYCDTLCFHLFDRSPHAWLKVQEWATREKEFEKRTAFALLWSLALHDRQASDAKFIGALKLVEQAAKDDRNFVKKAVTMALKAVGKRNPALLVHAKDLAKRLLTSEHVTARWIGKDALKEL